MDEKETLTEILEELKTLNQTISDEQKLRDEKEKALLEEQLKDKKISDDRHEKIENFLDTSEKQFQKDNDFHSQISKILSDGYENQSDSLVKIDNNLTHLVESVGVSDQQEINDVISYSADLVLILFILFAVPAYWTYKELSSFFDVFVS